jgi:hypothetical protein
MRFKNKVTATLFAFLAGILVTGTSVAAEERPTATVTFEKIEVSFIGSAKVGGGELTYKGKKYPFNLGGLGVGGIGVSKISGIGNVYKLKKLSDFEGIYGGLRAGIVVIDKGLKGGIWMENTKGVVLNLQPKRKGLALSLGVDGVAIEFEK